jgi:hypothetical protein
MCRVPAYYDQIVGDLYLVPEDAAPAKGRVCDARRRRYKRAAAAGTRGTAGEPQPIASFTRSNSGWMVNVSLPEAATQFGYRVGDKGDFTDPGFLVYSTSAPERACRRPIEMAPDQGKTTIYVTWRDKRGE